MLITFSHSNWEFPRFWCDEWLFFETWIFWVFVMKFCTLFKSFGLAGFSWHCFGRRWWEALHHYCCVEVKVQAPAVAFSYTTSGGRGRSALIWLGEDPCGLHWHLAGEGLIVTGWIWKSCPPALSSLTTQGGRWGKKKNCLVVDKQRWKSRFPTQPLLLGVRLEVFSVVFAWGKIVF